MSVELIFNPNDEGDSFEVAPNHAWRAFADWIDESKYPALAALAAKTPVIASKVATDIGQAESDDSATDGVAAVLARLDDLVADADRDAVLLVD